ncbi:MAG: LacI family DNA-binding transcriptional regulator [Oscillospiraceae bacterium]|nr:LacI family DNA-binding transcriptional regulator [Oscillospiraceae bacterium]
MATLDDIARELGVSKSTVSKALSGAKDVSKTMRQTVLEKAVELGYSRGVRNTTAPRIAVFVMNMEYSKPEDFGYDIVAGFRKAAEPAGYQVDIIPLDTQMQKRSRYDEYMVFGNYCGGLFLGMSLLDPWIKEFETCKSPTVLYDNHVSGNPNVTEVGVDNIEGMAGAISYLRSLGHTRIGYLSGALQSYIYQQRYQAFFRAMEKNGLTAELDMAASSYHIHECVSTHLPRLLGKGCTAVLCSSDLLAHSVMIWCSERGIRVPEDLSVLGFDDIPLCRYTHPPLSTIRQNRAELGKSAFYALSSQLNKVQLSSLLLHAELVKRASCTDVSTDFSRIRNILK